MSMVEDQKTARRIVRDYLEELGGGEHGHVIDHAEEALIEAIAVELAKARAAARPPLASMPRERRRG